MIWNREEYISLMTFGDIPRPMFVELFGPLIGLDEEWAAQGATKDEIDMVAFDFDSVRRMDCGLKTGILGGFAPAVLEENDRFIIERDQLGRVTKLPKGYATIALPLTFPVKGWEDWEKLKPFYTFSEDRIDTGQLARAAKAQKKGTLVTADIPGGFDTLRELMGEETCCVMCYEDPGLVEDILTTVRDTAVRCLERAADVLTIDNLGVHEDMAGKSGPLFGPKQVREFIKPYYLAAWDVAKSSGCKIFCQDSDGQMTPVVDAFLESGLTVMYPCEPAAGMDIVSLRRKYGGKLAFKGGIDKFAVRGGRAAIDKELEYKLQPLMHKGTVFGLDHRIPGGTPIEDYRYYVDTAREILGIPPRKPGQTGWERMAF